jgi:hypothetical protein
MVRGIVGVVCQLDWASLLSKLRLVIATVANFAFSTPPASAKACIFGIPVAGQVTSHALKELLELILPFVIAVNPLFADDLHLSRRKVSCLVVIRITSRHQIIPQTSTRR